MAGSLRSRIAATALALALGGGAAVGLAGCTAAPSPSPSGPPATARAQPTGTAALPDIPDGEGIIRATTMTACATGNGTVTAEGSITVPAGAHGSPVVSVSWVDADTSTAYARAVEAVQDATPGTPARWSVSTDLDAPAGTTIRCVLGAVLQE
ncbi:hypothetical protein [Leifsonia shinshuensis]|uniref:Ig-like domain-containing protein n=1 Tax=Leifsonia shinshuensis TaxID=150026 RepID=A0A7G6Y746_9MICO|nr:hypothetical protein [Leifsonia shinshuensis]QNE34311.1 hypothetical protein F1C12_03590 [Leifsonia shinshuensis]